MLQTGAKEIVLTGVNMSRYRDGALRFQDLVGRLLDLEGDFRLRISSLEPDRDSHGLAELFAHPKMTPHLHLCLQSGSDRMLRAMRRLYSYDQFAATVGLLRKRRPDINLTTDIIVGFPGESDTDLDRTLQAIEDLEFGHVHTFPYSEREGTRAVQMPGAIPHYIRTARAAEVRKAAEKSKHRYRRQLVGCTERLLVERYEGGERAVACGLGEHYVPIRATAAPAATSSKTGAAQVRDIPAQNTFVDVEVTAVSECSDHSLIGRVV